MRGRRRWFAWRPVFLSVWGPPWVAGHEVWSPTWRVVWFRWVWRWDTVYGGTHYEKLVSVTLRKQSSGRYSA